MSTEIPNESIAMLIAEFKRSGIAELEFRQGAFEIYLSAQPGGRSASRSAVPSPGPVADVVRLPQPTAATASLASEPIAAPGPAIPEGATIITAPNLGTFYRAPKPGAAPYVEIGSVVAEGDEICLIEVMKLFTAVRATKNGKVHAVIAEDGSMVEAGQPLFVLVDA